MYHSGYVQILFAFSLFLNEGMSMNQDQYQQKKMEILNNSLAHKKVFIYGGDEIQLYNMQAQIGIVNRCEKESSIFPTKGKHDPMSFSDFTLAASDDTRSMVEDIGVTHYIYTVPHTNKTIRDGDIVAISIKRSFRCYHISWHDCALYVGNSVFYNRETEDVAIERRFKIHIQGGGDLRHSSIIELSSVADRDDKHRLLVKDDGKLASDTPNGQNHKWQISISGITYDSAVVGHFVDQRQNLRTGIKQQETDHELYVKDDKIMHDTIVNLTDNLVHANESQIENSKNYTRTVDEFTDDVKLHDKQLTAITGKLKESMHENHQFIQNITDVHSQIAKLNQNISHLMNPAQNGTVTQLDQTLSLLKQNLQEKNDTIQRMQQNLTMLSNLDNLQMQYSSMAQEEQETRERYQKQKEQSQVIIGAISAAYIIVLIFIVRYKHHFKLQCCRKTDGSVRLRHSNSDVQQEKPKISKQSQGVLQKVRLHSIIAQDTLDYQIGEKQTELPQIQRSNANVVSPTSCKDIEMLETAIDGECSEPQSDSEDSDFGLYASDPKITRGIDDIEHEQPAHETQRGTENILSNMDTKQ